MVGVAEIKWPILGSTVDVEHKCTESELALWNSVVPTPAEKPVVIEGRIVRGFGRGGKLLRMPTGLYRP